MLEIELLRCLVACVHVKLLQSCLTLYDPMDHSLPGSSVHGILQARVLEWDAIAFSEAHSIQIYKYVMHEFHLLISFQQPLLQS